MSIVDRLTLLHRLGSFSPHGLAAEGFGFRVSSLGLGVNPLSPKQLAQDNRDRELCPEPVYLGVLWSIAHLFRLRAQALGA